MDGNYCSEIIGAWKENRFTLVSSLEIIEEVVRTLKTFKIRMDDTMIEEWRRIILENAIIVAPIEKVKVVVDDPDDNKFLDAAIAGDVQYIVSQDKHLLKIQKFRSFKIITPEEFLKLFY
ncbi:putative toxin-antitoxin system toxin component, PIN family [Candidatus Woesearchaeota archaeon]|nr:putative toxin-antitoxin system toxin component, PIN family [Candidatus Woesearchaeota archaeon]